MDKLIVALCIAVIALAFVIVIRAVVRQFRGRGCAGCPSAGKCGKYSRSGCAGTCTDCPAKKKPPWCSK